MATGLVLQPDNKIVLAGICQNGSYGPCLARYDTQGLLDPTFGAAGLVMSPAGQTEHEYAVDIAALPDGRIVTATRCIAQYPTGSIREMCLMRYLTDGAVDLTFGSNGTAWLGLAIAGTASALAIQADGKLLVTGSCSTTKLANFCVARFSPTGVLDSSFGNAGLVSTEMGPSFEAAEAVRVMPDSKIVLAGYCQTSTPTSFCIARFDATGALDVNFGTNGKVFTAIGASSGARAAQIQADGKLIAAGDCSGNGGFDFCVVRYQMNGQLDATFGSAGHVVVPIGSGEDRVLAAVLQIDGGIVAGGYCAAGVVNNFCLARFEGGPYPTLNCALNADANLVTAPATDAILLARYFLGLRGGALTIGALGQNPTRTGQALETYLASLDLDVDGDGQSLATTDGLLLLRAMLGLTGDALTQGATNASHPNVRNAQQILTWIESTHGVACLP